MPRYVALVYIPWVVAEYVVEWIQLMWVRLKIESWVFISACGPSSERSDEEIEDFGMN